MKKIDLIPVVAIITLLLSAGCDPGGYTIEGKISGDTEGKTVHLCTGNGPFELVAIDSTVIRGGKFVFTGKLSHPECYVVKIFPSGNRKEMENNRYAFRPIVPLFVSNGKITIEGDIDSIPTENLRMIEGFHYDFSKIHVTGPPAMMQYVKYANGKHAMFDKVLEANQAYASWFRTGKSKPADMDKLERVKRDFTEYAIHFIEQHGDADISALALRENLEGMTASDIDRVLNALSPGIKNSPAGEQVVEKAMKAQKTAIGSPFVDYTFQDKDGNTAHFSDHAGKGRYVLLEFWASWCGPCRADIPHLKHVYELYHPGGFEIISISVDEKKDDWLNALADEQMPWLQLSDLSYKTLLRLYNFRGIPFGVLVDPNGIIVDRDMRGPWLVRKMIELYGNKFDDN